MHEQLTNIIFHSIRFVFAPSSLGADEMLTHAHDVMESAFGRQHSCVALASCSIGHNAVLRKSYEEATTFFEKAFNVYREIAKIESKNMRTRRNKKKLGCGLGAASAAISLGRIKLLLEPDSPEDGLSKLRFGADFYLASKNKLGLGLWKEIAVLHETAANCVDFDVVESLENAAKCASGCYGDYSSQNFKALGVLGEKSEEGGDFERAKRYLSECLSVCEVLYGDNSRQQRGVMKKMARLEYEMNPPSETEFEGGGRRRKRKRELSN